MVQIADLMFLTRDNKELSFDKKVNSGVDHSFEEVLKKYQKSNQSSKDAIEDDNYDKEKIAIFDDSNIQPKIKREDEDKEMAISDNVSKKIPAELLFSLLSAEAGYSNISEDSYIETLKIIAPSLQKAIAQKSKISLNEVTEELKNLLNYLQIDIEETEIDGELNGIELLQRIKVSLGKADNTNNNTNNETYTQYLDKAMAENILQETDLGYDSAIKQALYDKIFQYQKSELKQIMPEMEIKALIRKGLISFINSETTDNELNVTNDQDNLLEKMMKIDNSNINSLNEVKAEMKMSQNSGQNSDWNYNSFENKFLKSELNMTITEPVKASTSAEFLDMTEIFDRNNPTASIEIIRELAEKISMNLKNNRYEIKLQVKPEHLGRLILKVTLEDGVLAGKIFTTNQQTGDLLQSNLNDLRNALEEQGYSFSQLDVNVGNESNAEHFHQPNMSEFNARKNTREFINSIDEMDELIEETAEHVQNYIDSATIDYFA